MNFNSGKKFIIVIISVVAVVLVICLINFIIMDFAGKENSNIPMPLNTIESIPQIEEQVKPAYPSIQDEIDREVFPESDVKVPEIG